MPDTAELQRLLADAADAHAHYAGTLHPIYPAEREAHTSSARAMRALADWLRAQAEAPAPAGHVSVETVRGALARIESAAGKAQREAEAHPDRSRADYCDGTAHGLRAAAHMLGEALPSEGRRAEADTGESAPAFVLRDKRGECYLVDVGEPGEDPTWTRDIAKARRFRSRDDLFTYAAERDPERGADWIRSNLDGGVFALVPAPTP